MLYSSPGQPDWPNQRQIWLTRALIPARLVAFNLPLIIFSVSKLLFWRWILNMAPQGNFEMEKWFAMLWSMCKIISGTKMKTVTTLLHWHWLVFLPWFFLFLVSVPILLLSSTLFQLQISSQVINFVRKKWDPRIKLCWFWKKNCSRLLYGYCFYAKVSGLSSHPTPFFYPFSITNILTSH